MEMGLMPTPGIEANLFLPLFNMSCEELDQLGALGRALLPFDAPCKRLRYFRGR